MLKKRILSTIIIAVWFVFLFLLSGPIREDISHTYHHILGSNEHLNTFTKSYSLQILGPGDYLSSDKGFVFYLFWGLIWIIPFAILFFTWQIKDPLHLLEFLFYSWLLYLVISVLLFLLAIFNLALPFLLL